MRNVKRGVFLLLLFLLTVILASCNDSTVDTPSETTNTKKVKVSEVSSMQIGRDIRVDATLLPSKESDMKAEINGEVVKKAASVGQGLQAEQRIYQLENQDIAVAYDKAVLSSEKIQQQLAKARAERESAIREAKLQQTNAQLQYETAKREYEQAEALYENESISESEFKQAEDRWKKAEVDLELAKERVQQAQSEHQVRQLQIQAREAQVAEREANIERDQLRIAAPFSGVIVSMEAEEGEKVTAGETLVRIERHNPLHVRAQVSESDLSQIEGKETLQVSVPQLDDALQGEVRYVAPSKTEDEDGFAVSLALDNANEQLRPGMSASLILDEQNVREVLTVPGSAVIRENGESFVYVVSEQTAEKQSVSVGRRTDEYVEITDGLTKGARIVVVGQSQLEDGDAVEIVK